MFEITKLGDTPFHTSQEADRICQLIQRELGWSARYYTAKLAISRSLSAAPLKNGDTGKGKCKEIRGRQLLGTGIAHQASWLALIVQHHGRDVTLKEFRDLIFLHWERGAKMLEEDWNLVDGKFAEFVVNLVTREPLTLYPKQQLQDVKSFSDKFQIPVGPAAIDAKTHESVVFQLNKNGGSPHMAFIGGTNSGKTYTATTMLQKVCEISTVPVLAFDFKGDLSEKLAPKIGANIISPPRAPVPLDVLFISKDDEIEFGIKNAAARIMESIRRVKTAGIGDVQADLLRQALIHALRRGVTDEQLPHVANVAASLREVYDEAERKEDGLIALMNGLCEYQLFSPEMNPTQFFSQSWVIKLPQDCSPEVRKLIVNLTLDALDRWINSLPDSQSQDGWQALRHVCLLDEAHVILSTKLPALANLIRMCRSKGGCLMLVSQSPDDFRTSGENFLDNIGLAVTFNTLAKAGVLKEAYGQRIKELPKLPRGQALCKMRLDDSVRKVQAWE